MEDQDIAAGAEHRVYLGRLAKLEAQVTQVHQELKAIQVILGYLDTVVARGFLDLADIRAIIQDRQGILDTRDIAGIPGQPPSALTP